MLIDLIRESVVIQGVIVLFLFVIVSAMLLLNYHVPDQLWTFIGIVVGYYFGSEKVSSIKRLILKQ